MIISVRSALPGDSAVVDAHVEASRQEARSFRGHLDELTVEGPRAIVVTIGDEIVGSAGYVDTADSRLVTHLYVVPECREVGAGDALMEWIIDDAVGVGLAAVRSAALPGDRSTKNLFERHGLIARAIQVERRLS